ncbi:MAG TPA: bifunctional [glutamine synthetase] adenylyltransferase/[glutamine synthetase]-adenylyl-L-tyrosine phosphorylase [Acidimicrobiales bacterium]|nr:bifunctional [glutamine synthetase] adenylyltransferase/[glutamine synthetase]-adenylyl-L-tyrosine phosphorylase [Acidimicrobiales bacterium]
MRSVLPEALAGAAERSAAPDTVSVALIRVIEERPDVADRLVDGRDPTALARAFITVAAASNSLGRLCAADAGAIDVLDALDSPVVIDATDPGSLARSKRLELLRIAARDLLGMDALEDVGRALADMAARVLDGACSLSTGGTDTGAFAVIGMGKLGGRELNYASDVDVMFVTEHPGGDTVAREILRIARGCFRVDVDLRPEGRSGPLTRSLDAYRSYWETRAAAWEFQALLKARPVAGAIALGQGFADAAQRATWNRTFSADELAELRAMKARAEDEATRPRLGGREIKRSPGGIRDVEFSVQLLQLVHGHHDPGIRDRSTLGALDELTGAGYVSSADGAVLADSYRFLRTVEHRLQLVEEEQTHALPTDADARRRLARVLGFSDGPEATATAVFDDTMRRCQSDVRIIHERLFFRPLLEAFAALEASPAGTPDRDADTSVGTVMSADAVARRLVAFGFGDARRTRAAVEELAGGLTRVSRLMGQLLPLLLDWLSVTPDPDLGLLGLRTLVVRSHHRALVVTTFRESPEAARRLCLVLGSSRVMAEAIEHNPELIAVLDDDRALAPVPRTALVTEAVERLSRPGDEGRRRARLVRLTQDQMLRIATRDLLDIDDIASTGAALTNVAEAVLEAAVDHVASGLAFCVVGMGRLGGAEMSYASDLDVLFVVDAPAGGTPDRGEEAAEALLRFVHGPSPSQRVATLDLGLRPEGGQGRLARDLAGYQTYFERWAQTWERQALLRARVVAGDRVLGHRFLELAHAFVWERPLTDGDVADIRRMKARIERERIPPREDPQFHLKLGRGSLSDIEWTVQLLQLRHGVSAAGTMTALDALAGHGALTAGDAEILGHAYRFLEHTRNRWHLVATLPGGTPPGDSLPTEAHQQSRLARSLGTSPTALRDQYRRVTRRARRVVERLFYGIEEQ